jgi:hypothetical protein
MIIGSIFVGVILLVVFLRASYLKGFEDGVEDQRQTYDWSESDGYED